MSARTSLKRVLALSATLVAAAALYAALPGSTLGTGETRVNTVTTLVQQAPAVARDANGDYVVVWSSATAAESNNVYFQRYNSSGVAQDSETIVNTTTAGSQTSPAVAMDAAGNFVVVWTGNGDQTNNVDSEGIFLQRFDAAGLPVGDETRVNTTTTNTQDLPVVATDVDGDFVVVWQSLAQDGSGQGVYGQRFDETGAPQGVEFRVNAFTTGSQRDPSVAMALDGGFAIVWESNGQDGDLEGIYGRVYAANGTDVRTEFAVNVTVTGKQDNPVVARAATGGFTVAFSGPDSAGSAFTDIYARRFDGAGNPIDSSEFRVNTSIASNQAVPAIALDATGDTVIAWESNHNAANGYEILARRYTAAGAAGAEGEVTVNSTTSLDQNAAAVAADVDGDVVVVWQGNGSGDANGVFARRLVGPEAVDLAITKSDDPDPVTAGSPLTYTINVENLNAVATTTGNTALDAAIGGAAGVVVTDTLSTGMGETVTFVQAQGTGWSCANSSGTVTCSLDSVLAADTAAAPIEITLLAPVVAPTDRTLNSIASVSSSQYDAVAANDSATQDTVVCAANETPGTLAVTNTSSSEGTSPGTVTVTRSGGTCGAVSAQVNLAAGTATLTTDFTATTPQTLTWNNSETGSKNLPVGVTIVNDTIFESNETVAVTLSNLVRATAGANGTLTINDNETAPSLAIADNGVTEGNSGTKILPLTVTLTPAAGTTIGRDVSVEFDTANGTATTADGDYVQVTDGPITFTPGQTSKPANVTINGDVKDETDETLTVTLSNANGATLSDASATGTITNDEVVPTVTFSAASSSVSEAGTGPLGNQPATHAVQVSLSTASSKPVTVAVGLSGTAASPADYTAAPTTVTFDPGVISQNVTLTIAIDSLDENNETAVLTLSSPSNATIGAQSVHTVTITDDDATPSLSIAGPAMIDEDASPATATLTVTLSAASGRDVSVTYGLGGSATRGAGSDYTAAPAPGTLTIAAGATTTTVTLTVNNDALDENDETVVATLSAPQNATLGTPSSAQMAIIDEDAMPSVTFTAATQNVNENVAGGTATATLSLSPVSGRAVTVPFTVNAAPAQGGDASGADFTVPTASPVTIPAGSTSATITINIVNDGNNEGSENVRLAMGTLGNATAGTNTTHVATILNDDALPQASVTAAQSKSEGAGNATVTVQLSRAAEQDVTLGYSVSGTAANGTDFTIAPASPLIIAEGESSGALTVTLTDDALIEAAETVVVTLTSAVNAAIVDASKTHTLTINDNDNAGVTVTQSGGSTDVTEGGATDTYTLVLTAEPSTSVMVSMAAGGQTTVTPSVTFTPSGPTAWNIPQTVTVTAVDDVAGEGPHTDTIGHTVSSSDLNFDGVAVADVVANITDDDVPAIVVVQSGGGTTVTEGGATDSYDVVLSAMPAQDVTVDLAHDAEVTLSATSLTFTPVNWDQAQPVTVTAVNDQVAEGTHASTIMHTSSSTDANFDGLASDAVAQITDDDTAAVVLSKTSAAVTEGGATDSYTVRLNSQPIDDVVVTLTGDSQVSVDVSQITFNAVNWNMDVTVTVSAVDDALDEISPHDGLVGHSVTATASDANYDGIAVSDVAVAVTDDDAAPDVTLSLTGSPLAENGGVATVTATLSAVSSQDVTVDLAYGGVAVAATDYSASATSITIAAGGSTGTVTLTAIDDALDEADETASVDIASVTNGNESGTQQVVATITDDDATPDVTLSLSGSPLAENGGVATVTATLSAVSGQDVVVDLAYGGTAAGAEYTAPASITIVAGNLTGTGTITGIDDAIDEVDETVVVDVASVTNGTESGTQQVTATLSDDDAPPSVTLSLAGSPLAENGGVATVTATLSAVSGQDVTVELAYGGTAGSGTDYTAPTTSITIAAGALTGTASVTGIDDAVDEPNETVSVDIASVTNGTESGTQQVVATITDDEAAPDVTLSLAGSPLSENGGVATVTATLSAASGQDVTVNLAYGGTASGADYVAPTSSITIIAGNLDGTATITGTDDALDEVAETVTVDIASVTNGTESGTQQVVATIADDDAAPTVTLSVTGSPFAETAGTATVTATLSAVSSQDVTVDLGFAGTATNATDYTRSATSISILAGSPSGSVTLTAVNDAVDEPDETVVVDITGVTNATENGTQQVTATLADDDGAPSVTLSVAGTPIIENGGSATLTATLSATSSQAVTVNLGFSGTALNSADYTRSTAAITIPAGSLTGTATVTAVNDSTDEANETVIVEIVGVVNGLESGTQQQTVTITDDDAPPATDDGGSWSLLSLWLLLPAWLRRRKDLVAA